MLIYELTDIQLEFVFILTKILWFM